MRITCLAVLLLIMSVLQVSAQISRPSMTTIRRGGDFLLRQKPTKEQKKKLQPNAEDLAEYGALLENSRTGIVRLLPDIGCFDNMNVLKVDEVCRNAIPESSYYSFREQEHTLEILSDIRLKSGHLISDGVFAQGFMTSLGNVPLESVTLESEGFSFMRKFEPAPLATDAKSQYIDFTNGIVVGDHEYRKIVKAVENATFAMRIIAYRASLFRSFRGWRFDLLEGDKRIDITLAFRVVRRDSDGSVTLVWRELERRESPRMRFPKKKTT